MRLKTNWKNKVFLSGILGIVFLWFTTSNSLAATFTRRPFLQNVKTNSIELRWVTDTHEGLIVKYGTTTAYGSQVASDTVSGTGGSNNHAIISSLNTNTKYFYQILTSGGSPLTAAGDSEYFFRTSPSIGSTTPFTFAIWGDSGNASSNQKAVAKQVAIKKPNLAVIAGDVAYGYTTDFTNNNNLYFNQYTDTANGQNSMRFTPYYVTCGNHELSCPTVMADHSLPGGGNQGGAISTYAFDYGNVHFVSLNSNGSYAYIASSPQLSDPQIRWAYNDLKASSQPWKVVIFHHNGWSAGSHSSNSAIESNLVHMASDAGADIVMWGHSHVYERWNKRTGTGFYPNVQEYTIGNGGQAGASSCTSTSPGPGCAAKSTASGESGFLYAEVNGDSMTLHYIKSDGSNPDTITLNSGGTVTGVASPTLSAPTATPRPTFTVTPRPSTTVTPRPSTTITPRPSTTLTPGPITQGAVLSLLPATQSLSVNVNGTLNANINPNNNQVASIEFVINYNPSIIRINNISPGPFFTDPGIGSPVEVFKTIDNTLGQIHYAVGFPLGSNYSSTSAKSAATISFTTLVGGSSPATYVVSGTPSTKVANLSGQNILATVQNATVSVAQGSTSTPTLRPTNTVTPRPSTTVTAVPTTRPSITPTQGLNATNTPTPGTGSGTTLSPIADSYVSSLYTTHNYGSDSTVITSDYITNNLKTSFLKFHVGSIGIQTADLKLKIALNRKAYKKFYTTTAGWSESTINYSNRPSFGTEVGVLNRLDTQMQIGEVITIPLNAGSLHPDSNGNISIGSNNTGDGYTLEYYSKESGQGSPKLVINGGIVGTTVTPIPTQGTSNHSILSFTPSTQSKNVGASGTVTSDINPNGDNVASIEIVATFDPRIIKVDSIAPGPFFTDPGIGSPVEVIKTIDNTLGKIHYAVGFPLGSNYSSSAVKSAATISFTSLTGGSSPITYVISGFPSTKVANLSGQNVLASVQNATIFVTNTVSSTPSPRPTLTSTPRPTLTATPRPTSTATPTSVLTKASLQLLPNTQTLFTNNSGIMNVYLDPKTNQVSALELYMSFDPSIVKVDNIAPGAFFTDPGIGAPVEIIKQIDNVNGTIYYALGFPLGSNYSSSLAKDAAIISFTALNPGTTDVSFTLSGSKYTKVSSINGINVLGTATGASILVDSVATLTPTAKLTATATTTPTQFIPSPTSINLPSTTPGPVFTYEGCQKATGGWGNISFPSQTGVFSAAFDATPMGYTNSQGSMSYVGFSGGVQQQFDGLAAIISFVPNGNILARDYNHYSFTNQMSYNLGSTYHIRFAIDLNRHTYSVYVTPPGGTEKLLALNFSFRYEQKSIMLLNTLELYAKTNKRSIEVCNLVITPMGSSVTATSGPSSTPRPTSTLALTATPRPTLTSGLTPTAENTPTIALTPTQFIATATPRPTVTPTVFVPSPTPVPCSPNNGDADGDGDSDMDDYNIWNAHYNQSTSNGPSDGDFNCSGFVDGVDYVIWLNQFNITHFTPTPIPSITRAATNTLTPTRVVTSTLSPTPLVPTVTYLSLLPSTQTVGINQTGVLNTFIDPKGENVSSMEIVFTYNPSLIRVTNIVPGPFFTDPGIGSPIEVKKVIDTVNGKVDYALGFPLGSQYSSTSAKVAAIVSFTALSSGTTQTVFVSSGTPSSMVANLSGLNVLRATVNAGITVQ